VLWVPPAEGRRQSLRERIERGNFCWWLYRGQRGNWREIERERRDLCGLLDFDGERT